MSGWLPAILLVIWALWLGQAALAAWKVGKFARRAARLPQEKLAAYTPPATVIVPFKGVDADLAAGIHALCTQDYPDYQLLLVVDSEQDPAAAVIRHELAKHPRRRAELLIAGPAGPREGQKVHNQLHALACVYDTAPDEDVWVFADSDAVPGNQWLQNLVGPLKKSKMTGVTTGYRWLIPTPQGGCWSDLASVINGSVACLLGQDELNHAWGGSMAIRAEVARRGNLRDRLVGALCDDYQFTRLCKDLGLRVYFVPQCLVATPVQFNRASFFNFAHRQYLLTRVYAPGLFVTAGLVTWLYVVGAASAWTALAAGWWLQPDGWVWKAAATVLVLVFLLNLHRNAQRRRAVRAAFGETVEKSLARPLAWDRWATTLWMTLHALVVLRACFGRHMTWRGIRYRLDGPQRVQRLDLA